MEKICTKCKFKKEICEFGTRKLTKKKDGTHTIIPNSICKKCSNLKGNIWKINNPYKSKILRREKRNLHEKLKRQSNPLYKLSSTIRSGLLKVFSRNGFSKKSNTKQIIGCTFDELKIYLETKFENWMNWENHGLYNGQLNYGWDIDHIIPLCKAKTESELLILCHYTNLQPLCSKNNRDIKKHR